MRKLKSFLSKTLSPGPPHRDKCIFGENCSVFHFQIGQIASNSKIVAKGLYFSVPRLKMGDNDFKSNNSISFNNKTQKNFFEPRIQQ